MLQPSMAWVRLRIAFSGVLPFVQQSLSAFTDDLTMDHLNTVASLSSFLDVCDGTDRRIA